MSKLRPEKPGCDRLAHAATTTRNLPREQRPSPTPTTCTKSVKRNYTVQFSLPFLVLSILLSVLLPYMIARYHCLHLVGMFPISFLKSSRGSVGYVMPVIKSRSNHPGPQTVYTHKHYDTSIETDVFLRQDDSPKEVCLAVESVTNVETSIDVDKGASSDDNTDSTERPQHLMVDLKHVDGTFLNSKVRLAQALVELTQEVAPILSYHCHNLPPVGVTCTALLRRGHVSLHTWPFQNVILLDWFVSGDDKIDLISLVPTVERLFGMHDFNSPAKVDLVWIAKRRGFPDKNNLYNTEDIDLHNGLLGNQVYHRKLVAHIPTFFQTVDIYDVLDQRSLVADHVHESDESAWDRVVYLDAIMQSRQYGEAAYHESLVHPALLLHDNPRRVAIVGGGEGATLREVLKHATVQEVVMIEIDERMVNASRKYLPQWSDCSDILSSRPSCFDDPRATVHYQDAIAWFVDGFIINNETEPPGFDVIIMDALDPSSIVEFSDVLYGNQEFLNALSLALGPQGVLMVQFGEAAYPGDLPVSMDPEDTEPKFVAGLQRAGFVNILRYEDFHGGFESPWAYMIALQDGNSRANWFVNEAQFNLELRERLLPSGSGNSLLQYVDGATMMNFQFPSRIEEDCFCGNVPKPPVCAEGGGHGYDPFRPNLPAHLLRVDQSRVAPRAGRGVLTTIDIAEGSYVGLETIVHQIFVPPKTVSVIEGMEKQDYGDYWETLNDGFMDGYGFYTSYFGIRSNSIDANILTFINHGCNGTYNVGEFLLETELSLNLNVSLTAIMDAGLEMDDPFSERHYPKGPLDLIALRDIRAGDELLDNYLPFYAVRGDPQGWRAYISELRDMCGGRDVGSVTRYEEDAEAWR